MTTKLLRLSVILAFPLFVAMTTSADRDVDRNSPVRKSPPGSTIKLVNPAPASVPATTTKGKPAAKVPASTPAPQGEAGVARSIHDWQPGSLNNQATPPNPKKTGAQRGGTGGSERAIEIDPKDAPGFP